MVSKKELSERDICTQFILPALIKAGWDVEKQIREEVFFTDGRIYVKGNKTARGERKRADYILYYKPQFISKKIHNQLSRSKVYPGDVLMNIVGPPLGKVAIVPEQFPEWNINQALAIFRPIV